MSQSLSVDSQISSVDDSSTVSTPIDSEETVRSIVHVLNDEDCRAILEATSSVSLSANEVSERCDLPLSTTYRKLETLTEVGLIAEGIRLSSSGNHTNVFSKEIEEVSVSLTPDGGLAAQVDRQERPSRFGVPY